MLVASWLPSWLAALCPAIERPLKVLVEGPVLRHDWYWPVVVMRQMQRVHQDEQAS
jgi:hypothetical protein